MLTPGLEPARGGRRRQGPGGAPSGARPASVRSTPASCVVVAPALVDVGLREREEPLRRARVRAHQHREARLAARRTRAAGSTGPCESSWNGCWCGSLPGVVAPERPEAAAHGVALVRHRPRHVDAVGDAGAVGDHERRARPGVGLEQRLHRLHVVRRRARPARRTRGRRRSRSARGPCAASPCRRPRTSRRRRAASPSTPARRCSSRPRCRARGRSRRAPRRARGRGPASRCRRPSRRRRRSRRSCARGRAPGSRAGAPRRLPSRSSRSRSAATRARWRGERGVVGRRAPRGARGPARSPTAGPSSARSRRASSHLAVEGEAHAEAELGVVLEQRVRPGRPAAVAVRRPRRRRQVAAVDRRAAGRVGDEEPVAEELREQLQVRRLAAARAGARELEQRLAGLRRSSPWPGSSAARLELGHVQEEREARALALAVRLGTGAMSIALCFTSSLLRAGQTSTHTPQPVQSSGATWIVSWCPGSSRERKRLLAEAVRRAREGLRGEHLHADRRVRADDRALAAVDADRRVPDRDLVRRSRASRSAPCRSGRCRRAGARSPAAGRPGRRAAAP